MWFLLGLLVGLSVKVEPSSAVTVPVEPLPLWVAVIIGVAAFSAAMVVALVFLRHFNWPTREAERSAWRAMDRARRDAFQIASKDI